MVNIDDGALAAIATSGLCTLGAQLVLWVIFAKLLGPGPWRDEPGFTAHQVICLPLMAICAVVGVRGWLSPETADGYETAEARVLGIHPDGRYLSHLIFGEPRPSLNGCVADARIEVECAYEHVNSC